MKQSVLKSIVSAALFSLTVAGCSSSTTPPPPTSPPGQVTPGKGSTFTTTETDTASGGGTTMQTFKDSVIATGLSFGGKTNVIKFISMDANGRIVDTAAYSTYESNGDVSTISPQTRSLSALFPSVSWVTLTVASQSTDTIVTKDSTISGISVHFALFSTGAGKGGTATIKG
jgi:hypothetical protein